MPISSLIYYITQDKDNITFALPNKEYSSTYLCINNANAYYTYIPTVMYVQTYIIKTKKEKKG